MNMAPQELERSASQYATDAIKYDSQGACGTAITNYQKAAELNPTIIGVHNNLGLVFRILNEILSIL